jgi:hypothetical protein
VLVTSYVPVGPIVVRILWQNIDVSRSNSRQVLGKAGGRDRSGAMLENTADNIACAESAAQKFISFLGAARRVPEPLRRDASAAQSERWVHVETHDEVGRRLASPAAYPSSLA